MDPASIVDMEWTRFRPQTDTVKSVHPFNFLFFSFFLEGGGGGGGGSYRGDLVNSLISGRYGCNLKFKIIELIARIVILSISCEIALRWKPLGISSNCSILVSVVAWCLMAPNHYLSQCQPRSMSPHGDTRPHWVNHLNDGFITLRQR